MKPVELGLCFALLAGAAAAGPAPCDRTKAFQDPGRHIPAAAADFQVGGALDGALDPETAARLRAVFDRGLAASPGVSSITVAVGVPGRGVWTAQQRAPDDPPAALHWWASAGKMLTAATVLQLADEGKLALTDPVSRWVDGVPNGHIITVEQLLNHTSGLYSANEDPEVHGLARRLSFEDRLAVIVRHGPLFCPGAHWRYSNTGYDLLGRIIERVDGRPYAQAVTARILTPLGLTRARILTPDDTARDLAPITAPGTDRRFDPTEAGPAGALAASAPDTIRILQGLLGSKLLKPETTARLLAEPYPMFDPGTFYGLGLMLYDIPDKPRNLYWIGHGGGAPGVGAQVSWSPHDGAFVAVALTGEGSPQAFANALLRALAPPTP
jgi:D-alanyl-D-alanine carboxypeptidase